MAATGWKRIAKRIRVPMGFVFAGLYLWLARPTPLFMALSLALVVPGVLLRAYASGYVKKNRELTVTGPYAYTRNPLYLGSMTIAFGFALAARSIWIAVALAILFAVIYIPVIRGEEEFLRSAFPEFDAYATRVPRLLPRITPAKSGQTEAGEFSSALYWKHREYNALIGAAAIYIALALRLLLLHP
ncbi:methyltransferase family protein [Paracidobacterium acidisoli]|uniref:Isoprenylcysteine carboxylmethyltransferase family protein n=1 Tax=Paracidobacterium acidisoli TaxID=2303751 RepID=A0A372IJ36_9BACT|nr:isoprenylcysteine carboxylmethyltransferase family protein [Paracidobacterium acidisoli]MBT9333197.1 isoprenylcysteine carboxylmethyltransferase family protein [Paracidobacterium acidisoli]